MIKFDECRTVDAKIKGLSPSAPTSSCSQVAPTPSLTFFFFSSFLFSNFFFLKKNLLVIYKGWDGTLDANAFLQFLGF